MPVKEMCIANPIVKGQYQTADNPIFEVFYLADAQVLLLIMDNHQKNIHYNIYF